MDNINDLLTQLSKSPVMKKTDKQLQHYERLSGWRESKKNKRQFAEQGMINRSYTEEQVYKIRTLFWETDTPIILLYEKFGPTSGGGYIPGSRFKKIMLNQSYQSDNFPWDVSTYETVYKNRKHIRRQPISQKTMDVLELTREQWLEKYNLEPTKKNKNQYSGKITWLRKKGLVD